MRKIPAAKALWLTLAIAIVLALVFFLADPARGPLPHGGFLPQNALVTLQSRQAPSFYAELRQMPGMAPLIDAALPLRQQAALAARFAAGIRPTDTRWRLWLGNYAAVAVSPDGWGFTARPTRLFRLYHRLENEASAVRPFGDYYCGWRAPFVVIGSTPAFVAAALANEPLPLQEAQPGDAPPAIHARWAAPTPGHAELSAVEGLPFTGALDADPPFEAASVPMPASDIPRVLASLSSPNIPRSLAVLQPLVARLASLPAVAPLLQALEAVQEQPWAETLAQDAEPLLSRPATLALGAVEDTAPLPIPALALLTAAADIYTHPLEDWMLENDAVPYRWAGHRGWQRPLYGQPVTLCAAFDGQNWHSATYEPLMNSLMESAAVPGPPVLAALRLNWHEISHTAVRTMQQARESGLLPRGNPLQQDELATALLAALKNMGRLDLRLVPGEDCVIFSGKLAAAGVSTS